MTSYQPKNWSGYDEILKRKRSHSGFLDVCMGDEVYWERRWFELEDGLLRHRPDARSSADEVHVDLGLVVSIRSNRLGSAAFSGEGLFFYIKIKTRNNSTFVLREKDPEKMGTWLHEFHMSVASIIDGILRSTSYAVAFEGCEFLPKHSSLPTRMGTKSALPVAVGNSEGLFLAAIDANHADQLAVDEFNRFSFEKCDGGVGPSDSPFGSAPRVEVILTSKGFTPIFNSIISSTMDDVISKASFKSPPCAGSFHTFSHFSAEPQPAPPLSPTSESLLARLEAGVWLPAPRRALALDAQRRVLSGEASRVDSSAATASATVESRAPMCMPFMGGGSSMGTSGDSLLYGEEAVAIANNNSRAFAAATCFKPLSTSLSHSHSDSFGIFKSLTSLAEDENQATLMKPASARAPAPPIGIPIYRSTAACVTGATSADEVRQSPFDGMQSESSSSRARRDGGARCRGSGVLRDSWSTDRSSDDSCDGGSGAIRGLRGSDLSSEMTFEFEGTDIDVEAVSTFPAPLSQPRELGNRQRKGQKEHSDFIFNAADKNRPPLIAAGGISAQGPLDKMEDVFCIYDDLLALGRSLGPAALSVLHPTGRGGSKTRKTADYVSASDEINETSYAYSLYAVFDGHAGAKAARFVARELSNRLAGAALEGNLSPQKGGSCDWRTAVTSAFLDTDACTLAYQKKEGDYSGSTAVALVVRTRYRVEQCIGQVATTSTVSTVVEERSLLVANIGDSLGVLSEGGQAQALTSKHSPGEVAERIRVESVGGWVTEDAELLYDRLHHMDLTDENIRANADRVVRWVTSFRVNGDLSVSRAFGDPDFKGAAVNEQAWNFPPSGPPSPAAKSAAAAAATLGSGAGTDAESHVQLPSVGWRMLGDLVIADPFLKEVRLSPQSEFALLASDGLWDVLGLQEAVDECRSVLSSPLASAARASEHLTRLALRLGSNDNTTVVVIPFQHLPLPSSAAKIHRPCC